MAATKKKRDTDPEGKSGKIQNNKKSDNDEDESSEEENFVNSNDKVINVDFEGRNPIDSDFHGIKQLLRQLFLKAHINLTELTNLIIEQNYVGSVIKQCERDGDDSDEEDFDANEVFGITTVINLTRKQNLECIQQLKNLLIDLAVENGSKEVSDLVKNLLCNENICIGLLVNERFINIPAQIAVPMLKSLESEIKRAADKNMAFNFSYYVLICKLYRANMKHNKISKKKKQLPEDIIWSNPEEEIIEQEADASFEFSVEKESDSGLSGQWEESDDEMTPFRRVFFISASKLNGIVTKIEEATA